MRVPKELVLEMAVGQRQILDLRRGQRVQLLAGIVDLASEPVLLPGLIAWPLCQQRLYAEEAWVAGDDGWLEIVCRQRAKVICLPPPPGAIQRCLSRLHSCLAGLAGRCGSRNLRGQISKMAADCHSGKPPQEL